MKTLRCNTQRRIFNTALALAVPACLLAAFPAQGEPASAGHYPDKPISLILGYPAGGINDVIARRLAVDLADELKVPVVVENKAGANGAIAANYVAKSRPDGHTIMFGAIGQVSVNPYLRDDMPYAPEDLIPIVKVAEANNVLVVNAAAVGKYPNVAAIVEKAKSEPRGLAYASFGIGSSSHLSAEMFAKQAGLQLLHVPYKGSAPAMVDLIGGNVDFMFDSINTALPHIEAGRIVPLAITKDSRSQALPNVATLAESGFPDYRVSSWFGLHAPKGTPRPIVDRLNEATRKVQAKPEVIEFFQRQNIDMTPSTPEEYGAFVEAESQRWGTLIKELDLEVK